MKVSCNTRSLFFVLCLDLPLPVMKVSCKTGTLFVYFTVWETGPPYNVELCGWGWGVVGWRLAIRWMLARGLISPTPRVYSFKILKSQTVWLQKCAFHTRIYVNGVRTRVRTHFGPVHLVQGFMVKRVRTESERESERIKHINFIQGFMYKLRHGRLHKQ